MKKKNIAKALALLFTASAVISLASCNKNDDPTPNPDNGNEVQKFTITYNTQGHGTTPAQASDLTSIPSILPELTADGYTFGGWYTDSACTTPVTKGATLTANITLYAKWTKTTTPSEEVTLVSISVSGTDNESVALNGEYVHSDNVVVTATMSNNTTKDVTNESTFDLDTTLPGEQTCTVTYQGKTATYTVDVINAIVSVDAVTTDVKREFTVGDDFTAEGLVVQATYADNSKSAITDYSVHIKATDDINATDITAEQFKALTVSEPTTYYIYLVSGENTCKYTITLDNAYSYTNTYLDVENFENKEYVENFVWGRTGAGSTISVLATSSGKVNVDENAKTINDSNYSETPISFTKRLKLNGSALNSDKVRQDFRCVKIEATHAGVLRVVAISGSSTEARELRLVDSNGATVGTATAIGTGVAAYEYNISTSGTYYLFSAKSSINLYGIKFSEKVYDSELGSYTSLELDTTNVKKKYKVGETFDPTGIKVYGKYSVGTIEEITEGITYEDEEGNPISTLNVVSNSYKIIVKAQGLSADFTIQVTPLEIKLGRITVTTKPQVEYISGEKLDLSKMVIKSETTDGTNYFDDESNLSSTSEGISYKLMNGENEVDTTQSLTSGKYVLVITYTKDNVSKDVSVDINVFAPTSVESTSEIFKNELAINEKVNVGGAAIVIECTLQDETAITRTYKGSNLVLKYYSDEECTTTIENPTQVAGKVYYKVATTVNGQEFVGTDVYTLTVRDYTNAKIVNFNTISDAGKFGKDTMLPDGTMLSDDSDNVSIKVKGKLATSSSVISTDNCIKFDKDTNGHLGFEFTATSNATIVLTLNASGTGKILTIDNGTTTQNVSIDKNTDSHRSYVINISAGETINLYSVAGGVQLIQIAIF